MDKSPPFIPGLRLGRMLYEEVGRAIVESVVPRDSYAAALIGYGSDVLGYDSQRSTDHNWGPRFQVFLPEDLHEAKAATLDQELKRRLPHTFHGFAVCFADPDPEDFGTQHPVAAEAGSVQHLIEITTFALFFDRYLGKDPRAGLDVVDWLSFPEQRILELTAGAVFHDPHGDLGRCREVLREYPSDVWLYKMACQWHRLSQEEAFVGRCNEAGDPLGMRLVAGRIVRDLMKLCFIMERRYAPYDKWLGSAFGNLRCAAALKPLFERALSTGEYREIEQSLAGLYRLLAEMHNALGVTGSLDTTPRLFFDRPYLVIQADRFTNALLSAIECPELRAISVRFGAIDQFSDNTDFIENVAMYRKARGLYA